jgi:hypothetical protein
MIRAFLILSLLSVAALAQAQPAAKGEAENLVPPGGAAFDVPLHAGEVCILSFPEQQMTGSMLASSRDFEVKTWGTDGVAVRANGKTGSATLALSTTSALKVNVTLRVVPAQQDALTLVRFKLASAEEAFEAKVTAEVAKRVAPLQAELASTKKGIDAQIRERTDTAILDRILKRNAMQSLSAHERNGDNVIVHVQRAITMGDDGYLLFEIENRSNAPYRLTHVTVSARDKAVTGPVRLLSSAIDKDPNVLALVPAGTSAHGIVAVRGADQLRGVLLALDLADASGRGTIQLNHDIVLK